MGVVPDDREAWEAQVLACVKSVEETDDYGTKVQALRRMRHLAARVERQLTSERFWDG